MSVFFTWSRLLGDFSHYFNELAAAENVPLAAGGLHDFIRHTDRHGVPAGADDRVHEGIAQAEVPRGHVRQGAAAQAVALGHGVIARHAFLPEKGKVVREAGTPFAVEHGEEPQGIAHGRHGPVGHLV